MKKVICLLAVLATSLPALAQSKQSLEGDVTRPQSKVDSLACEVSLLKKAQPRLDEWLQCSVIRAQKNQTAEVQSLETRLVWSFEKNGKIAQSFYSEFPQLASADFWKEPISSAIQTRGLKQDRKVFVWPAVFSNRVFKPSADKIIVVFKTHAQHAPGMQMQGEEAMLQFVVERKDGVLAVSAK